MNSFDLDLGEEKKMPSFKSGRGKKEAAGERIWCLFGFLELRSSSPGGRRATDSKTNKQTKTTLLLRMAWWCKHLGIYSNKQLFRNSQIYSCAYLVREQTLLGSKKLSAGYLRFRVATGIAAIRRRSSESLMLRRALKALIPEKKKSQPKQKIQTH